MQYQPSTNDEQVGQNHPKFEGGKVASAVVKPPQAHRELQGKQNKAKQSFRRVVATAGSQASLQQIRLQAKKGIAT